ncbi:MAG: SAM-dependent chlorinase/fluorinase, partial [Chloroflexi bacterium]|nr:SAM-dependent chlorinase/fluorinase [Chloroflexota bacterium]
FHGRDLFAPAAARLACGAALEEAGPALDGDVVALELPSARRDEHGIHGEVLRIDRFGNAISNIPRSLLDEEAVVEVRVGETTLRGLHRTYADVQAGAPLALFESNGYLAVAVNLGDASATLGIRSGDTIEVRTQR